MTDCKAFGALEKSGNIAPLTIDRRELRGDDVAIAIAYCGVCHTDLHFVNNDWGSTVYPCVPGHEIVGHVTAIGDGVTAFGVGDRVAVGALVDSCQRCDACEEHEEPFCTAGPTPTYNSKDRIDGTPTYGGYSEAIVVRDKFVLKVPDALDMRFAGPLLCAGITVWTPLRQYNIGKGSKVAVAGLGGLGHLAVKLAAALGAEVTVITTSSSKADDARALGASDVLLATDRPAMVAAANRFDLIIDTIPSRHDLNPYLMMLGRKGAIALVGAIEPLEPMHGGLLMRNHRSVSGSLMGGIAATQELLDFCAEHQVLPECELIGVADIDVAFERMHKNDVKYRFVIDMASIGGAAAE